MEECRKDKACSYQEKLPVCTQYDIKKVALVSCSNGLPQQIRCQIEELCEVLKGQGLEIVLSPYLYANDSVAGGTARQRADFLMQCYGDPEIIDIYDVSGGDVANEILPYLNYEMIDRSDKKFWGYSDLTTVINAIYTKTGKSSVLYQIRNLVGLEATMQLDRFKKWQSGEDVFTNISCKFVQGDRLEGIVVGGNIRCFLKLAGTPYWPDLTDKVLLLEARGGGVAQMTTYLSQLQQLGAFEKVRGVLLGTFTQTERENQQPDMVSLVRSFVGEELPVAKTRDIGHGADAKGILVGASICLRKNTEDRSVR